MPHAPRGTGVAVGTATMTLRVVGDTFRAVRARQIASGVGIMALLLGAPPAEGGLVPGGGPAASDCYVELDVAGIQNGTDDVKHDRKVICRDGDPCDTGPCGDGVCDMQVRLCWNQDDANVPECIPAVTLDTLQLRGPLAALLIMPRDIGGAQCSEHYVDLPVPTAGNGKKPGKLNVRMLARAPAGTVPRTDRDWIKLTCMPRPVELCFGVTTTTAPTGSTTTTSSPTGHVTTTSSTTTTKPPKPRQTTTTSTPHPTTSTVPSTSTVPTTSAPPPTTLPTTSTTSTLEPTTIPEPTTTTSTPAPETTTTTREKDGDDGITIVIPIPLP